MSSSLHTLLCYCVPALLCVAHTGWAAEGVPTLAKEWEVSLGPVAEGRAFYRGAVCGDGTYYLSNGLGRVVEVNAAGVATSDVLLDVLQTHHQGQADPELSAGAGACGRARRAPLLNEIN